MYQSLTLLSINFQIKLEDIEFQIKKRACHFAEVIYILETRAIC